MSPSTTTRPKCKTDDDLQASESPSKKSSAYANDTSSLNVAHITGAHSEGSMQDSVPTKDNTIADNPLSVPGIPLHAQSPPWLLSPSGTEYRPTLLRRLKTLMNFSHYPTRRYTLPHLPPSLVWGNGSLDNVLTFDGKPVIFWIFVELTNKFLETNDGKPVKYISLTGHAIVDTKHELARDLLHKYDVPLSLPATKPDDSRTDKTTLRFSRTTTKRNRQGKFENTFFDDIYDATHKFCKKSDIDHYLRSAVGINDLVLIECHLQRYHVDNEGAVAYN